MEIKKASKPQKEKKSTVATSPLKRGGAGKVETSWTQNRNGATVRKDRAKGLEKQRGSQKRCSQGVGNPPHMKEWEKNGSEKKSHSRKPKSVVKVRAKKIELQPSAKPKRKRQSKNSDNNERG